MPWSLTNAVSFTATGSVPVIWNFVKAHLQNGQTKVSWSTHHEINTDSFYVEHSIDGTVFSDIGQVKAAGQSNTVSDYAYTHLNPVKGFNYYRIRQTDFNGDHKRSVVVKVLNNKDIKETMIAPNPVTDLLNVIEPQPVFVHTVEVFDNKGSLLMRKTFNKEVHVYSLPVTFLKNGQFILKITDKAGSRSYPFIKR